jgi:hypothetical protein
MEELALSVAAAAMRLLLACRLAHEAAREYAADGAGGVRLADNDGEVL